MRKKPWAYKELAAGERLVRDYSEYKDDWCKLFGNKNPLHCEIGCGKGRFIVETALKNPDINFIAIERAAQVLAMAIKNARTREHSLSNLYFINADADELSDIFASGVLSRIYINFCDPWPNRKKWAKRRLTYRKYLNIYLSLLANEGEVFFKTDNEALFDFSIEEFRICGFELGNVTRDLHNSGYSENVATEYEERFINLGRPIYRLEAYKQTPAWT